MPCGRAGAGAEVVVFVFDFVGEVLVTAAVETADVKMKMPASAMVLSMGFSCGFVWCDDA
jgi:hypothetical protein